MSIGIPIPSLNPYTAVVSEIIGIYTQNEYHTMLCEST